jgi:lipopolysaccharide export system protein LptA
MCTNIFKYIVFYFVFFLLVFNFSASAQKHINYKANLIEYDKKIAPDANRLIGNVVFIDRSATMYCDSAYFHNTTEDIDAFGNIRIIPDKGNTSLTGNILHYIAKDRIANITGNVVLINDSATLRTQSLFYNMNTGVSNYPTKGTIESGQNKIVSSQGTYNKYTKQSFFKKNVVVTNPQYVIHTDTMNYNTGTKIVDFLGPTIIVSNENDSIYCEKGWYNTNNDISSFRQNAWLKYNGRIIKGDTLYFEKITGLGKAYGHIETIDTSNNIIVRGNYATYDRNKKSALVTKQAMMIQVDKNDSLYLHADTIFSGVFTVAIKKRINDTMGDSLSLNQDTTKNIKETTKNIEITNAANDTTKNIKETTKNIEETANVAKEITENTKETPKNKKAAKKKKIKDDEKKALALSKATLKAATDSTGGIQDSSNFVTSVDTFKFVRACHHVKFFRSDLQGKCDSMYYSFRDSTLQFLGSPVLWTGAMQMKAEHITLFTKNNVLERMELTNSAFIINQDDSVRYNQIRGRNMTGYFVKNELHHMFVIGNGQTIYFARDKNKGPIIGIQKCESTDITLRFKKKGKPEKVSLDKITYKKMVAGVFHPPQELTGNDLKLKDFEWLEDDRPKSWQDIFKW